MPVLKFIDIAANLTDGMFKGMYNGKQYHAADIGTVLKRAWDAGVDRIIVTGGSLQESKEALALADTDGRLFCTVGVHPTRCKEFEDSGDPEKHYQELLSLAKDGAVKGKRVECSEYCVSDDSEGRYQTENMNFMGEAMKKGALEVVAIGECGLDYDRLFFCPADVQRRYFARQFDLAEATGLPMFLHMRAAGNDFCDLVRPNQHRFVAGVVHSFTGTAEDRQQLLSFANLYLGVNGCSLKSKENLDVLAGIPLHRLMIETDSPYCGVKASHAGIRLVSTTWPSKKKEKYDDKSTVKDRNEPCHIRQVFEVVAATLGVKDLDGLSRIFYENTCRVFFPHDLDTAADAILSVLR